MFATRTTTVTMILAALVLFAGTPLAATAASLSPAPSPHTPPVDTAQERDAIDQAGFCAPGQAEGVEKGYIQVSEPAGDRLTASEVLYFHVFDGFNDVFAGTPAGFIHLQDWTNGVDAYVIDLGCVLADPADFCVRNLDPLSDNENAFPLLDPENIQSRDYAAKYFESDQLDTTGDDSDVACEDGFVKVPKASQYIVIYLEEGLPRGVQLLEQGPAGAYSTYFCAKIETSSGC